MLSNNVTFLITYDCSQVRLICVSITNKKDIHLKQCKELKTNLTSSSGRAGAHSPAGSELARPLSATSVRSRHSNRAVSTIL